MGRARMQDDLTEPDAATLATRRTTSGSAASRAVGRLILRGMGWRIEGSPPDVPKAVMIGAPHTSNWDLLLALGVRLSLGLPLSWMMKREAFWWPMGPVWRSLGGIPVDRRDARALPRQMARWFGSVDQGWLGIAPEGTRESVTRYKRGYLHIAKAAGVPVIIVGVDAPRKTVVFDRVWQPGPDINADNAAIRDYIRARYSGMIASRN